MKKLKKIWFLFIQKKFEINSSSNTKLLKKKKFYQQKKEPIK